MCLYPAIAAFAATYRVVLIEWDPVGTAIAVVGWTCSSGVCGQGCAFCLIRWWSAGC